MGKQQLETESTSITPTPSATWSPPEGTARMYFKKIRPLPLNREGMNVVATILRLKSKPGDQNYAAEQKMIVEGLNLINTHAGALVWDYEFNQCVDSSDRPHDKWECGEFQSRMGASEMECYRDILSQPKTGNAPKFRVLYKITKAEYVQEIEEYRKRVSDRIEAQYRQMRELESMVSTTPDSFVDQELLVFTQPIEQDIRRDPDLTVTSFDDDKRVKAMRRIRAKLRYMKSV